MGKLRWMLKDRDTGVHHPRWEISCAGQKLLVLQQRDKFGVWKDVVSDEATMKDFYHTAGLVEGMASNEST